MDFFWIYDLPMVVSFTLIVGSITAFAVGGIFVLKPFVSKWWSGHDNNDQIAFYLSAVGVFYGITLGLLAAGVWQNLQDAEQKVNTEASATAALYRDVKSFPSPLGDSLKMYLQTHTYILIHESWELHHKGVVLTKGTPILNKFQDLLYGFKPQTLAESNLHQEALKQYNKVIELRVDRLNSVNNGMPSLIWLLIFLGGAITLIICWLFNIPSLRMHIIMNALIGLAVGTLIYLIIMLDYPFRGHLAVDTGAYELVYNQLMK